MSKPAKKKPQPNAATPKTDRQYLLSGMARRLPIVECWINPDWQSDGYASIIVARQHKNGNYTVGTYLVDIFCLGLKQTDFMVNGMEEDYRFLLENLFEVQAGQAVGYSLVHNIIYGGIAYADDLDIKPNKDWVLTQYILADDDDEIELIELEFGRDGQPFFFCGPYDKPTEILAKLEKAVGRGNFGYEPYVRENDPLGYLNSGESIDHLDYDDDEEWDDAEVVD